jgi:hypothetical protein
MTYPSFFAFASLIRRSLGFQGYIELLYTHQITMVSSPHCSHDRRSAILQSRIDPLAGVVAANLT